MILEHADQRIRYYGKPISASRDLSELFAKAGVTDPSAQKVLLVVSEQEGGFEALNTCDAGYVSVGFIQFTTGRTARGCKLVAVLQRMKDEEGERCRRWIRRPNEFEIYFRSQGLDTRDGLLLVTDPHTAFVREGSDAVQAIRTHRKFPNMFQYAGRVSRSFQLAQIAEAYETFYLAHKPFRIPVAEVKYTGPAPHPRYFYGQGARARAEEFARRIAVQRECGTEDATGRPVVLSLPDLWGNYGDVFTSEAGKAAIMDRAVQYGVERATRVIDAALIAAAGRQRADCKTLRLHQKEIIAAVQNRIDALNDERLSQPWEPERYTLAEAPSSELVKAPQ
jgi:hypothetical protein